MSLHIAEGACVIDAGSGQMLTAVSLNKQIALWQEMLQGYRASRVVLTADSSLSWMLVDLACLQSGIVCTPLPTYLSCAQLDAVLEQLQPDLWLTDSDIDRADCTLLEEFGGLQLYRRHVTAYTYINTATQKVTFTSGSTGAPKGVCLSAQSQLDVALALKQLVEQISPGRPRHLCLLPLPTLLENIAGVYAPLLAGGDVIIAPDFQRGFCGSNLTSPQALLQLICVQQPKSLILVPELLKVLIQAAKQGWPVPASLEFIAVGGAYVSPALLLAAARLGLPVYQGYGLSECASVVALSVTPTEQAKDDVGQPLPSRCVEIINGEIVVKQPFLGYLGDESSASDNVFTGDLGELDSQGRLRILGRRKNLLISSLGRNISPEWPEALLTQSGLISQAVVVGDGQPYCAALLYLADVNAAEQLPAYLQQVNQQLPDYAQIKAYQLLSQPLSVADGTLTANGRPRRAEVAKKYQSLIADLFPSKDVTGESYEFLSNAG
ncbi:long-subunit acyl-CoA synthetase (AMP-forming) [Rheinheimera pacifica]|uniref:AMP-binding protein n=1 Tax=Rheinheimera pacifica TaxID=173990 RepID=UPI0028657369|nr:AMP-binding protein [Rheinheimera pacifica]MDR6982607.1 long-subunit acyl-CoA synthetase (AMP-forming) [Rheinheimera pacifica]